MAPQSAHCHPCFLAGVTHPLDAGKGGYVMHGGATPYSRREWQVRMQALAGWLAFLGWKPGHSPGPSMHSGGRLLPNPIVQVVDVQPQSAVLALDSPAGDQGFPGNLSVLVTYTLTDDNELAIGACLLGLGDGCEYGVAAGTCWRSEAPCMHA